MGHVQKTNVARPRALLTVGDATARGRIKDALHERHVGRAAGLRFWKPSVAGVAGGEGPGSRDAQHSERFGEVFSACREKLENVAKAIAHCDAHAFDYATRTSCFYWARGRRRPSMRPNR